MTDRASANPKLGLSPAKGQRERVQRAIEDNIAAGVYKPGQRLDEREIAARLKVSRTPVREALNRLASVGLVEARPNQGCFVASLSFQDFLQQYEFMADLEALCSRLAARRMEEVSRARLRQLAQEGLRAAQQEDLEAYLLINTNFHQTIYSATKNRFLEQSVVEVRRRMSHYRDFSIRRAGRLKQSADEHSGITDAIVRGDSDEAHRLMRWHMEVLRPDASDFLIAISQTLA
ncbi:GntR family transcriptional regulator [Bradyrhizobium vignae]|uniref:GntR family transcriptional regulator n=1 Tax=Bradyrhizobium vignae TaxID=1549949 RepID=UPI0013E8CC7D|nr:GntR family transcriptional regulator [Bradyrhizobium vignae]